MAPSTLSIRQQLRRWELTFTHTHCPNMCAVPRRNLEASPRPKWPCSCNHGSKLTSLRCTLCGLQLRHPQDAVIAEMQWQLAAPLLRCRRVCEHNLARPPEMYWQLEMNPCELVSHKNAGKGCMREGALVGQSNATRVRGYKRAAFITAAVNAAATRPQVNIDSGCAGTKPPAATAVVVILRLKLAARAQYAAALCFMRFTTSSP